MKRRAPSVVGQVPPPGSLERVKLSLGFVVEAGVDHGSSMLVVVLSEQVGGVVRT